MKARPGTGFSLTIARLSAGFLLAGALFLNLLGDRFWWTVPIIYGPRWVWGAALLGIVPLLFRRTLSGLLWLAVGGVAFGLGIMDYRLGLGRYDAPTSPTIRLLEFNAEGDGGAPDKIQRLLSYIGEQAPDIIVIAECSGKTRQALIARLVEYTSKENLSLCLLAKGEILTWETRDPTDFWRRYGAAHIVRADLRIHDSTLRIGLVHLATPRRALALYNDSTKMTSMRVSTVMNLELRDQESQAARFWITEGNTLPLLVAGDFNLPVASAIYQRHWGDLGNAYSATGVGLGHTKEVTLWGVRIDHILTGNGMQAVRSWIGPDLGSDHRPMVADVGMRKEK